jgi:hypothetical protein
MMTMERVDSTNVKAIGYDPVSRTMRVEFKSGGAYDYPDVQQEAFDDFLNSDSKGRHFHKHIRSREYVKVA